MSQSSSGLELGLYQERFIGFRSIIVFAKQNVVKFAVPSAWPVPGTLHLNHHRLQACHPVLALVSECFHSSASLPERAPLAEAAQLLPHFMQEFCWSFSRHLARSSLFPSYCWGRRTARVRSGLHSLPMLLRALDALETRIISMVA